MFVLYSSIILHNLRFLVGRESFLLYTVWVCILVLNWAFSSGDRDVHCLCCAPSHMQRLPRQQVSIGWATARNSHQYQQAPPPLCVKGSADVPCPQLYNFRTGTLDGKPTMPTRQFACGDSNSERVFPMCWDTEWLWTSYHKHHSRLWVFSLAICACRDDSGSLFC